MLEIIILLSIILIADIYSVITDKEITIVPNDFDFKEKPLTEQDIKEIRDIILLMDSREFEVFCADLYKLLGHSSMVTKATADGGKDVVLDDGKVFVECKHWLDGYVGRPIAQKLYGAMGYSNSIAEFPNPAEKGIIFTTAAFSDECIEYCEEMNIELVDLEGIIKLVREVNTIDVLKISGIYVYDELEAY